MTFEDECSVYVGGLAYTSTEDELQEAFDSFGEIISIKIVYDRETGQSRGFGFVTFSNPRSASKAIHELDGGMISGRTIRVNEVKKQGGMNGKPPYREGSFRDRDPDFRDKDRDRHRDRERHGRGRLSPPRHRRTSPGLGRSTHGRSPGHPSLGRSTRGRSPDNSSSQGHSARVRSPVPRRSRTPLKDRSPSLDSSSAGRHRPRSSATSLSPGMSEHLLHVEEASHRAPLMINRVIKIEKRKGMTVHSDSLKVREELERAHQSQQELAEQVASLRSAAENARETVGALQNRSKRLEEALESSLSAAKNTQILVKKIQRGVLQVKESSERLSRHEKELKMLMSSIDMEALEEEGDVIANGVHFDGERKAEEDMILSENTRIIH